MTNDTRTFPTRTAYARDSEELRKIRNIIKSLGGVIIRSTPAGSLGYQVTYRRDHRLEA